MRHFVLKALLSLWKYAKMNCSHKWEGWGGILTLPQRINTAVDNLQSWLHVTDKLLGPKT